MLTAVVGFVYDIATGEIFDLNVSRGPPGYVPPVAPPADVAHVVNALVHAH